MSTDSEKGLMLLFQKPLEPVFTTRDDGKATFDLPESFYTDRYKNVAQDLQSRFGEDVDLKITLNDISKPDLGFSRPIKRRDQFSLFNDKHRQISGKLITLFMQSPDVSTFLSLAAYCKDRVNPVLFQYCFSVTIQHRPDTKNLNIPNIVETFPSLFVDPAAFPAARQEASVIKNPGDRMHIDIPQNYTASDREEEQRMAYFREDIGINMHHWHWHLVYPQEGPPQIVEKDRRGELFFYMHHQIQARYNLERFCNHLPRVKNLNNLRETIPEGYFPKIISSLNNRTYPSRANGSKLSDIDREDNVIEIADIERWRDRLHQAIDQGYIHAANGQIISLDEVQGIDILGNLIEASQLSANRTLYGNLHNMGHNLMAFAHDPDSRYLEDFGVMGDVTTAMRDPIFYRWHGFIDSILWKFKSSLPQYTEQQLGYSGISVDSVQVKISLGSPAPNVLITYWQKSDVDLAAGLDFGPNGNIFASYVHLQHAPFNYKIMANNTSGVSKMGTCRIFIGPKSDERGAPLKFNERRALMIEMDKFTVDLKPGNNIINRRSDESSVTIPYERSFRRVGAQYQPTDLDVLGEFRFCGCGWPQHMLLPKGTAEGMPIDVFVMISNYADDMVEQPNSSPDICGDAHSFCGLKDKLYPDKRAMGYPFDRMFGAQTLEDFTSLNSNMTTQPITVKFNNTLINLS